ncbi:MAG: sel1 repeat family protein [Oscillospiraceae bacterium]|nr:sel1 repeat family protein [Oscillospiraceae bacterium]
MIAFVLVAVMIISFAPFTYAAASTDSGEELLKKAMEYEYSLVSRDYSKAFSCYKQAADLGYADAIAELGWIYIAGEGTLRPHNDLADELEIEQDEYKAYKLFRRAADMNSPSGIAGLGYLEYQDSDEINENCEFFKLLEKAASMGDPRALMYLGDLFFYFGDNSKGVDCFTKAAAKKDPDVLYYMAFVYYDGGGYDLDSEKEMIHYNLLAFSYFLKSGELGHLDGANMAFNVIAQFDHPDDIKKLNRDKNVDFKKVFRTASLLASYDDYGAMYLLGYLYDYGLGVKKNAKTAKNWYDKAEAASEAAYEAQYGN